EAAAGALHKALQLAEVGSAGELPATRGPVTETLLFYAMAQWQCGKHEKAKDLFQQAAHWMETDFSKRNPQERVTRAEAAALLGAHELPPHKAEEESPHKE